MGNLFSNLFTPTPKKISKKISKTPPDIWEIPSCHKSLSDCKIYTADLQNENNYLVDILHKHHIPIYTGGKRRTKRKYGGQSITYNNKWGIS